MIPRVRSFQGAPALDFCLTYSNWETGTICYSESLESLSEGWQNAVWELGAVAAELSVAKSPPRHRIRDLAL
jgi:hypothetical protein